MTFNSIEEGKAYFEQQIANTSHAPTRQALQEAYNKFMKDWQAQQTQDKMGELSDNLLDFNSDFYKQYQSYLQKTVGGVGANSLLTPLMAGGTGYAGGQAIASERASGLNRERQDKINTGVREFALGNIGLGGNLLGQQGNLQLGYAELAEKKRQYEDQNSGLSQLFGALGSGAGLLFGGAGMASGVGGYGNGYTSNSSPLSPAGR